MANKTTRKHAVSSLNRQFVSIFYGLVLLLLAGCQPLEDKNATIQPSPLIISQVDSSSTMQERDPTKPMEIIKIADPTVDSQIATIPIPTKIIAETNEPDGKPSSQSQTSQQLFQGPLVLIWNSKILYDIGKDQFTEIKVTGGWPQDWDSSGCQLLFRRDATSGYDSTLYAYHIRTKSTRTIISQLDGYLHNADWSPDDALIAYVLTHEPYSKYQKDIYLVSNDGAESRRLTEQMAEYKILGWSSDSTTLYYAQSLPEQTAIYQLDVQTGISAEIVNLSEFISVPNVEGAYLDIGGVYIDENSKITKIWFNIKIIGTQTDPIIQAGIFDIVTDTYYLLFKSKDSSQNFYLFSTVAWAPDGKKIATNGTLDFIRSEKEQNGFPIT